MSLTLPYDKLVYRYSRLVRRIEFLQASAVGVQGMISLLSIARTVVIVRLLGAENYGLVGLASAAGGVFAVLQHFGLGVAAAKEASQATDTRQLGLVTGVLLVVRFALLLPLLAFLFLIGAPLAAITYHQPALLTLIRVYALYLLVSAPGDILGYILTGTERYRTYFTLRILNEVVMTVAMIGMVMAIGVHGYFWGYVAAGVFFTLASGMNVWRLIGRQVAWPTRNEVWRSLSLIFTTSLAVFAARLLRSFSGQVPMLIAGLFLSPTALGWLKFAQQAGNYLNGFVSPVLLVTLPRMTRLQARQGTVALLNHFSVNFRRVTWGTGLMLLLALVFSREISWLIGGVEFSSAWQTVQFMLVFSGCVVLADNIFTAIHFPLDRERLYVLAYSGLFVISLAATAILISTLKSADSVALAMMSGAVVLLGLAVWQVNDLPGLLMSLLRSIVPVAFTVFLGLSSRLIEPLGWRILMGVIGFWLICLDMLRSDQAAQRIVRSGMGYVRLMAQRWF